MKKKTLWLLSFIVIIKSGSAQDTLTLKMQDALDATIKNNREILLATLDNEAAVAKYHQTNAVFLPQITASYTAMVTNDPLNVFGFKLRQQSVTPPDFNPELLNNPSEAENYSTQVEWKQPLINLDMLYQRKAARQQADAYYYKKERTKEYMQLEIQKAYAQLQLAHQAVAVLKEALHTVNSIFETSKNYFEKGLLQKSDLLLVQVQVASIESNLAIAKSNVHNASDYISLLMGTKCGTLYVPEPLKKVDNIEILVTSIPADRADFKAMESGMAAQKMMVNSGKMSYLPKLNGFANYMLNDKTAFGFGSDAYLMGAQFSWNLFNGSALHYQIAEQKIAHAKIEQQLNYQKEQGQLELNKTLRQLQDVKVALQLQETSVSQAAEALRILQSRFVQGLVSTNDLLQSQSTLSEQKLLQSEAIFNYNTTLNYIQFLTSNTENK